MYHWKVQRWTTSEWAVPEIREVLVSGVPLLLTLPCYIFQSFCHTSSLVTEKKAAAVPYWRKNKVDSSPNHQSTVFASLWPDQWRPITETRGLLHWLKSNDALCTSVCSKLATVHRYLLPLPVWGLYLPHLTDTSFGYSLLWTLTLKYKLSTFKLREWHSYWMLYLTALKPFCSSAK